MCPVLRLVEVGGRGGGGDERPRPFGGRGGQLVILEAEMVLWRNFDLDDVIVKG
jgi:hypothetical protein